MIFNFDVVYASGREERLTTTQGAKAREIQEDLRKAVEIGAVTSWRPETYKNASDAKKARVTSYVNDRVAKDIHAAAIANGRSVSQEVNHRLGGSNENPGH